MRPLQLLIGLVIGVVATLAAGLAMVSADNGEADTEAPLVLLEPGDNFVGWIEEPIAVEDLFDAMPEIAVIFFWDAASLRWRVAAPAMPSNLWTLLSIDPGMAVLIRNGTDESIPWNAQTEPTRGMLRLYRGTNWISWAGPDDWPVKQVGRGIGEALIEIRLGDVAYDPLRPETAEDFPLIMRGAPLQVSVRRSVNWPQPTGLQPTIEFPGGAPETLRRQVQRDLSSVMSHYSDTYYVQADPNSFLVVIPADAPAWYDWLVGEPIGISDDLPHSLEQFPAGFVTSVRGDSVIFVRPDLWAGLTGSNTQLGSTGRYILSHEYAHVLQHQLDDPRSLGSPTPGWIAEGTASWAGVDHAIADGVTTRSQRRAWLRSVSDGVAVLHRDLRRYGGDLVYSLGEYATDVVLQSQPQVNWLELFRHLSPTQIGPRGRWHSSLTWEDAFEAAFGMSLSDFQSDFEQLRKTARSETPNASDEPISVGRLVAGRIVRTDGSPISNIDVLAWPVKGGVKQFDTRGLTARTDEQGYFQIEVASPGEYALQAYFQREQSCPFWYGDDLATDSFEEAKLIAIESDDIGGILFETDICTWYINGQVVGPNGDPLPGMLVRMSRGTGLGSDLSTATTTSDGYFAVRVKHNGGSYSWSVQLRPGCHYPEPRSRIQIPSGQLSNVFRESYNVTVRVPADACSHRIEGRILNAQEADLAGLVVFSIGDRWKQKAPMVDERGRFSVELVRGGVYRLRVEREHCGAYLTEQAQLDDYYEARQIDVRSYDEHVAFVLPHGFCSYEVKGRIVDRDSRPVADTKVRLTFESGYVASFDLSSENGEFAIPAPGSGKYLLDAVVQGCVYGWKGTIVVDAEAKRTFVAGRDTNEVEFDTGDPAWTTC